MMKNFSGLFFCMFLLLGTSPAWAGHSCTGSANCRVCTNCNYCAYCNSGGGRCGVCSPHAISSAPSYSLTAASNRSKAAAVHKARPSGPPATLEHRLTEAELAGKSLSDMSLMRNQIYARHGYIFQRADLLAHFSSQPWYRPDTTSPTVVVQRMSPTERANVGLLARLRTQQQVKMGIAPVKPLVAPAKPVAARPAPVLAKQTPPSALPASPPIETPAPAPSKAPVMLFVLKSDERVRGQLISFDGTTYLVQSHQGILKIPAADVVSMTRAPDEANPGATLPANDLPAADPSAADGPTVEGRRTNILTPPAPALSTPAVPVPTLTPSSVYLPASRPTPARLPSLTSPSLRTLPPTYSGDVYVHSYFRKDGTFVRSHTRSAPGSGRRSH